ncbi:prepilin-type cleavage/methylation domain-containing protein [Scytonema sp. UIC 10036]|uniref:pilus assembly FimT family protein n=1 Tax=Scytonema sp. UIC 10036 TaxID=2304196 RepID=UPI0012DA0474|nr:type II secretion system protein [Scytonema sp. UIC 10036]MUH00215.1 prepilin-type cleavage/methylation domain-containing protein [Scytonema sp. UIC 10036]
MQAQRFKNCSNSGFTMLEIVVIVLIISLLAAIAVPSWLAFVDIQRLKTAQGEAYQAMRQAQSLATKNKLTWQVSFRDNNGIVQWTVHQAQADKFLPYAISVNDNLWHNLDINIRIDTIKNNKGKSETTLPQDTSTQAWRVLFNYQGCPIYQVGDECTQTSLRTLGQITFSSKNGGKAKRCVYISTILGAMRTGKEHDKANDNGKYCY